MILEHIEDTFLEITWVTFYSDIITELGLTRVKPHGAAITIFGIKRSLICYSRAPSLYVAVSLKSV